MSLDSLLDAVRADDAVSVRACLEAEPQLLESCDGDGKTPLHWAAEVDAAAAAETLLQRGARVEAKASWGATPLDWAATVGSSRVAELILQAESLELDLVTAASLGHLETVQRRLRERNLVRRRAATAAADATWPADTAYLRGDVISDAFYSACRNGQLAVAECLLVAGAEVDSVGVFGATALQWAALGGHEEVVRLLVARGADAARRDPRFDSDAAGWAAEGGHTDLAEWLRAQA